MDDSSNFEAPQAVPPATAAQLLATGLAALKRRDYSAAIALLKQLQTATSAAHRTKAQMGLIAAYEGLGHLDWAVDLCQPLIRSPSAQVRSWAQAKLTTLSTKAGEISPRPPDQPPPAAPPAESDQSGFVPLEPKTQTASGEQPGKQPATRAAPEPAPDLNRPTSPPAASAPPTDSLFHYQQLNATSGVPPATTAAAVELPEAAVLRPDAAPRLSLPQLSLPQLSLSNRLQLWGLEIITAIAFFGVASWLLDSSLDVVNWLLRRLQWIRWPIAVGPVRVFASDYRLLVAIALLGLMLASPWIMDALLKWQYDQRPLSTRDLKTLSPQGITLLRRICTQRGWPLPELRRLPESAPLCFTYGWHPRNMRIVLSQGLVDQFSAEELASLLAYEMAHAVLWDLPVMSGMATVLLMFYQAYWQLAQRGDRLRQPLLKTLVGAAACLCYGGFWLLRKVTLWLSRRRSEDCDRAAVAITGAPQMHQQCLLKLTGAIAIAVDQQGRTPPLLESLDYLMPLSQRLALSPGSSASSVDQLLSLLSWDYQNPYRSWLLWNLPHLPTGARLRKLDGYRAADINPNAAAKSFGLKPEVSGSSYLPPLLLQGSPIIGALLGLILALGLWFLGGIADAFNWFRISWFYQDGSIIRGFFLLGIGIGMILRVNRYFPDLQTGRIRPVDLATFQKNPLTLPVDSQTVQVSGTLLGRSGTANWLCQDLIVRTTSGLVRLHVLSGLGPLGNFGDRMHHPVAAIGQEVSVTGWLRRGPTLWLDVKSLRYGQKTISLSNPPLWTTLVGLLSSGWGIWILFRGY